MNYTITIDGTDYTNKIKIGFSIVERLNEKLDSGLLLLPFTTIDTELERYSKVNISVTDDDSVTKTFDYLISSDALNIASKDSPDGIIYSHTLTLIEPSKKLDSQLSSALTYTQPTDGTIRYTLYDVIDKIRAVTPLTTGQYLFEGGVYTLISYDIPRLFDLNSSLETKLKEITAPQFFFNNLTVREALNETLSYVNSISRLDTDWELTADEYNQLNSLFDRINNIVDENKQADINSYATSIRSLIENQISDFTSSPDTIVFPDENGYQIPRGDTDVYLSTDNIPLILPQKIYTLSTVECYVKNLTYNDINDDPQTFNGVVDITDYVYEKQVWDTFDVTSTDTRFPTSGTNGDEDVNYKSRTLYYVANTTKIDNIQNTEFDIVNLEQVIENIVRNAFYKQYFDLVAITTDPNLEVSYSGNYTNREYSFKVTYLPVYDSKIDIERNNISSNYRNSQLNKNQVDKLVSVEQFTNNLYGDIQRLGNEDIEISNYSNVFTDIHDLGDYTSDNFIVDTRELFFYDEFMIGKYRLTKNFNRLQQFINVNSEYRSYEIPIKRTLERELQLKNYVEVGFNTQGSTGTVPNYITSFGKSQFMNTFKSNGYRFPVKNAIIDVKDTELNVINPKPLLNTCISVGGTNTLVFKFGFLDNQLAGRKLESELVSGKNVITPVRYTDEEGIFENMNVVLTGDLDLSGVDLTTFSENLPEIEPSYVENNNIHFSIENIIVKKDPSEIIDLTYQSQIIPATGLQDEIVIGRGMCIDNGLVTDVRKPLYLYLYEGTRYGQFDNLKIKTPYGTRYKFDETDVNGDLYWEVDVTNRVIVLNDIRDLDRATSYAIGTDDSTDGFLYLAVNQESLDGTFTERKTISFDFVQNRSDIDYEWN